MEKEIIKLQNKFKDIKNKIQKGDILECATELDMSPSSVQKYVNGNVQHIDRAVIIIGWFNELFQKREAAIKAVL